MNLIVFLVQHFKMGLIFPVPFEPMRTITELLLLLLTAMDFYQSDLIIVILCTVFEYFLIHDFRYLDCKTAFAIILMSNVKASMPGSYL